MDGLEAVEIKLSEVLNEKNHRMESEFYVSESIQGTKTYYGYEVINFVQYGTSLELNEENNGIPTLRLNEFEDMFIKRPLKFCNGIDEATYERLRILKDDVLICRTNGNPNYVGKAAVVIEDTEYIFASYLFRVRTDKTKILPEVLTVYLNCKYGRKEISKFSMSGNQTNFSPAKFKEISIPKIDLYLQERIKYLVVKSYEFICKSNKLYKQAEDMLLSEIGFKENELNNKNISVKTLSSSFNATGRLDAEYYQPKYDEIIEKIKNYKNGSKKIAELCKLKDSNYLPLSGKEYKYIELSNIGTLGNIIDSTIDFGENLPSRARRQVKSGNIIVSSIEGSLKSCAIINENYNNAICSTGFYVLSSKLINSETLLLLFKSEPVQLILKQNCSGTILTSLNKIDFLNIELPIIDGEIQNNIKELILETNILKQNSEKLLNIAKQSVEMAIEEGELTAIKWIEEKMKDITKQ